MTKSAHYSNEHPRLSINLLGVLYLTHLTIYLYVILIITYDITRSPNCAAIICDELDYT